MQDVFASLTEYAKSDAYPYHMPGHKRQGMGALPEELAQLDITEIDGFDNLHQPEGILQEIQKEAAVLYGAGESFLLVNGSSCGVLSAISAAVSEGGRILMVRNCHKSAYHAAYLRGLDIVYLYPDLHETLPMYEAITPEAVGEALEREQDIEAVFVVSPTYEGRIADIREIAKVVHAKGIPLIVDEAHGAHLGFHPAFSGNSNQCGADLVIHSVHKTLPSMTQTALLHVNGELIDTERLKRFLRIYQSTSPSYVLMASIANALHVVEEDGERLFSEFVRLYDDMEKRLQSENIVRCPAGEEKHCQDRGKLVLYCVEKYKDKDGKEHKGLSGQALYNILKDDYHLQLEMSADSYCLAMFTLADGAQAYDRMVTAVRDINHRLYAGEVLQSESMDCFGLQSVVQSEQKIRSLMEHLQVQQSGGWLLKAAWDAPKHSEPLPKAIGMRCGEFINLYPPGAPILVPGEQITLELAELIEFYRQQGMNVQGVTCKENVTCVSVISDALDEMSE